MTLIIPTPIAERIAEYPPDWTGKIVLNVHKGIVGSADAQEHIRAHDSLMREKSVDTVRKPC